MSLNDPLTNVSWTSIYDQTKQEMNDKAPLVTHAYKELQDNFKKQGTNIPTYELGTLALLWASMTISGVEDRIKEMREDQE